MTSKDDNELSLLPLRVMAAKERGEISADLARDILKGLSVETTASTETDCSAGVGGVTLVQMAENIKLGLDPYTGSETICQHDFMELRVCRLCGARPSEKAKEPQPNDAFRWICIHCTTVNGIDDPNCLGCRKPRYPLKAASENGTASE